MKEIKAKHVLANYFYYHPNKSISIPRLRDLQTAIESRYYNCFVDISWDSIGHALEEYSNYFYYSNETNNLGCTSEFMDEICDKNLPWYFDTNILFKTDLSFIKELEI